MKFNGTDYPLLSADGSNFYEWKNALQDAMVGLGYYWLIDSTDALPEEKESLTKLINGEKDAAFLRANRNALLSGLF